MNGLLAGLLYRAEVLPAGEMEWLSWFETLAEVKYFREVDAFLNGEVDAQGNQI